MDRGGAETMIMNVYRKIDKEIFQFDFLCMSDQKGAYEEEIKEKGGEIYRILPPQERGYLKHIFDIIKICKKNRYDVIHVPTQFHSGIVCLAAFLAHVPIRIVHSHSAGEKGGGIKRKIYKFICRRLINIFATNKIACGEKARDFLFGNNDRTKKQVLILKNGIDIEEFAYVPTYEIEKLKKEINIKKDEILLGHIGRFEKVKNHIFFIKIAKELKKEGMKFKILLVGDGSLKESIEKEIKRNKLEENFVLVGSREDVPIIMNAIDIFVMPSLYEGFPMTLIEAFASGTYCVVSDNVSKETAIVEENIEFLKLNENISEWKEAIKRGLNVEVDKEKIIRTLKEKGFDVNVTVKELEKIYLERGMK